MEQVHNHYESDHHCSETTCPFSRSNREAWYGHSMQLSTSLPSERGALKCEQVSAKAKRRPLEVRAHAGQIEVRKRFARQVDPKQTNNRERFLTVTAMAESAETHVRHCDNEPIHSRLLPLRKLLVVWLINSMLVIEITRAYWMLSGRSPDYSPRRCSAKWLGTVNSV